MLSIEEVNQFLNEIGNNYGRKHVASGTGHQGIPEYSEGKQGDYNESWKVYETSDPNLFWKIIFRTNSYGYDDSIYSIQLVEKKIKEVQVYE